MHLASASMPALPGAQYKSLHNGERAIAQHKACSLAQGFSYFFLQILSKCNVVE